MRVYVAVTAAPGTDLVGPLERAQAEVTVLRRVEDAAEMLAVGRSGTVDVLLFAGDLAPVTRGLLAELDALSRPVGLVAVSEVAADRARMRSLGVVVLRADADPLELADALTTSARDAQGGRRHADAAPAAAVADAEPLPDGVEDAGPRDEVPPPDSPDHGTAPGAGDLPGAAAGGQDGSPAVEGRGTQPSQAADQTRADGPGAGEATAPEDRGTASQGAGTGPHRQDRDGAPAGTDPAGRPAVAEDEEGSTAPGSPAPGRITAVWGPAGAPGRTTVAANLAAEAAVSGARVLLVDADTYGPAVGVMLGLTDESAGIAQAARAADRGRVDGHALERAAVQVRAAGASLWVLTGLTRPDRWPELRAAALEQVLTCARECFDEVVVDVGFCLQEDEELSFDIPAPQRNGATLAALRRADRIVAVGGGDALGLPRLMRGVDALREAVGEGPEPVVVVNRVRPAASGSAPRAQITATWKRFGPAVGIAAFLPADPAACDRALLTGQLLAEAAPKSALRRALQDLAVPAGAAHTEAPEEAARPTLLHRARAAVAASLRPGRRTERTGARLG